MVTVLEPPIKVPPLFVQLPPMVIFEFKVSVESDARTTLKLTFMAFSTVKLVPDISERLLATVIAPPALEQLIEPPVFIVSKPNVIFELGVIDLFDPLKTAIELLFQVAAIELDV